MGQGTERGALRRPLDAVPARAARGRAIYGVKTGGTTRYEVTTCGPFGAPRARPGSRVSGGHLRRVNLRGVSRERLPGLAGNRSHLLGRSTTESATLPDLGRGGTGRRRAAGAVPVVVSRAPDTLGTPGTPAQGSARSRSVEGATSLSALTSPTAPGCGTGPTPGSVRCLHAFRLQRARGRVNKGLGGGSVALRREMVKPTTRKYLSFWKVLVTMESEVGFTEAAIRGD